VWPKATTSDWATSRARKRARGFIKTTREHTKSLLSASESRSAFSGFATEPFCSETNCKTVQKWTGTRVGKFIAEQLKCKQREILGRNCARNLDEGGFDDLAYFISWL
jgi:hypothetical protein